MENMTSAAGTTPQFVHGGPGRTGSRRQGLGGQGRMRRVERLLEAPNKFLHFWEGWVCGVVASCAAMASDIIVRTDQSRMSAAELQEVFNENADKTACGPRERTLGAFALGAEWWEFFHDGPPSQWKQSDMVFWLDTRGKFCCDLQGRKIDFTNSKTLVGVANDRPPRYL